MKFIHIAGTNGKGSVAEFIYQILLAAGKRCGCFTSPHLISPAERLRMDGRCINQEAYHALLDEVKTSKLAVNDTLFAAQTAAALLWFERGGAEYAVLETGLGGRLDPTNAVIPILCVLTAIDYDHTQVLGPRLEQIAGEKSGIIKQGVPVISAAQHPAVVAVIADHCRKVSAPLIEVPPISIKTASLSGQTLAVYNQVYDIRALGAHQAQNAALAVLCAQKLGVENNAVRMGLKQARLRCRTQIFLGTPDILLDGAHNSGAVTALLNVLGEHFSAKEKVLLFACMADKDYETMIKDLAPHFNRGIVTRVDERRGADPVLLQQQFEQHTACQAVSAPIAAFHFAENHAIESDALLVVAGSFYLAGMIEPLIINADDRREC